MAYFDTQRIQSRANRAGFSTGPGTGFVENMTAAYEASRLLDSSIGDENALYDIYDEEIDRLRRQSLTRGRELFNPVTGQLPARLLDLPSQRGLARNIETHARLFGEEAARLGFDDVPGLEEMRARAARLAADRRAESADIRARATDFGGLASLVGSITAGILDPPILASMTFGAGAASGILRTALIESAVAGGTEIAIQPLLAQSREQLGIPLTAEEAMQNILFATAGGALFGGGAKAIGRGLDRLGEFRSAVRDAGAIEIPQTTELLDASAYLERAESLSGLSPYTMRSIEAQAEHMARLDEAMLAGREGRPASIPATMPVPVRADLLETLPTQIVDETLPGATRAIRAATLGQEMAEAVRVSMRAETNLAAPRERVSLALQDDATDVRSLEDLAAFIRNPRNLPKPQSLTSFLQSRGGLQDQGRELTLNLGLRPRDRPGLISRRGMRLDDAALAAQEAGFFPERRLETGDRITTDDLVEALRGDITGAQPRFREIDADDLQLLEDVRELERALDAADLDIREIEPGGLEAALDERAFERRVAEDTGASVNIDRSEADFRRLETTQEEIDKAVETEMLFRIRDNPDEFEFEMPDGEMMTGRQLLDDLADDERALSEFADCVTGAGAAAA